jgi:hypothetical protein
MDNGFKKVTLNDDFELHLSSSKIVRLYKNDTLIKEISTIHRADFRLFIVDAVALGVSKKLLSDHLDISRQSIHNWMKSKEYFGVEGVIHSYNPDFSKNLKLQRKKHNQDRVQGDKARMLEQNRKEKIEEIHKTDILESEITKIEIDKQEIESSIEDNHVLTSDEQPYAQEHDWHATRYAGIFTYIITMISQNKWLELIIKLFKNNWTIFMVFLLMASKNIRSIEQLKNIRSEEAGFILGIGRKLPAKKKIWQCFYKTASIQKSHQLLSSYFKDQIKTGLVNVYMWFIDGHLLPYTGKHKTHYAYSTQRKMPMRGQTNIVTCDIKGRIVDFAIEEGKGDLRARIVEQTKKWEPELPQAPVTVFDREGYDGKFFYQMIQEKRSFITWEKNIKKDVLDKIPDDKFTQIIRFNDREYNLFEGEKVFEYEKEDDENKEKTLITFSLRRIYIWNKTTNKRTCGLAWDNNLKLSTEECAQGILSRWGASENVFKHIQDRHPFHYHPGFKLIKSENQEIKNPEIKTKELSISNIKISLNKLYKKLSKTIKTYENTLLENKQHKAIEKIKSTIYEQETSLKHEQEEKTKLPVKINVSNLANYKSFNRIDNEGKNIFDFVTSSTWNARKTLVEWIRNYWDNENEIVDLFYAITHCHGWIKNTDKEICVRLEPLEKPKMRAAQQQLCRKLTSLVARLPSGKKLVIEVGENPLLRIM